MTTTERSNEEMIAEYRQTGDRELYDHFFEVNYKLGWTIVNKFTSSYPNEDPEDLLSLASWGMIKAFDRFQLDKGYKFTTYAGRSMENEIKLYLRKNRSQSRKGIVLSLDMQTSESDGGADALLQDIIPDVLASEATARVDTIESMKSVMEHLKDFLSERELYILCNHLRDQPVNFEALGKELGSARSSVHKTAQRAYRKARLVVEKLDIVDEGYRPTNHKVKKAFSRDEERYRVCRGVYVYLRQQGINLSISAMARKIGVSDTFIHGLKVKYDAGKLKDEPLHPSELDNIKVPVR